MIVFVSYSRQDNDLDMLHKIEKHVARIGRPYIDDLHDHEAGDRQEAVHRALHSAAVFVAVHSPNYLKTPWTYMEYQFAMARRSPIIAVMMDGILIEQSTASLGCQSNCANREVRRARYQ
jgi:hypothetical protein